MCGRRQQCTVATLQFVLLKPLLSIAAYVLDASTASRNGPSVRWARRLRVFSPERNTAPKK